MSPRYRLPAIAMALLAAAPAAALPPPAGPPEEVGWKGPGLVCEADFTLRLEPGEFAREDIQLEPWYPVSDTVKSAEGWYSIKVLDHKPPRSERVGPVRRLSRGKLYRYEPRDQLAAARFIMIPKRGKALQVSFWRTLGPSSDWMVSPTRDYDPARYEQALNRISFGRICRPGCLNAMVGGGKCVAPQGGPSLREGDGSGIARPSPRLRVSSARNERSLQ